jgi:hypothetical protein
MQSASVSVVKTSGLPVLAEKVRTIMSDTVRFRYLNNNKVQQLATDSNGLFFDFLDFMRQMLINTDDYNEFDRATSQTVIYKASTGKILDNLPVNTFSGVSIFIPDTSNIIYHDFYKKFDWYKNTSYSNYFDKYGFIH